MSSYSHHYDYGHHHHHHHHGYDNGSIGDLFEDKSPKGILCTLFRSGPIFGFLFVLICLVPSIMAIGFGVMSITIGVNAPWIEVRVGTILVAVLIFAFCSLVWGVCILWTVGGFFGYLLKCGKPAKPRSKPQTTTSNNTRNQVRTHRTNQQEMPMSTVFVDSATEDSVGNVLTETLLGENSQQPPGMEKVDVPPLFVPQSQGDEFHQPKGEY